MKLLALLTLAATLTPAFAAEEFGGIKFHSSVPREQISPLKYDLAYLYTTPVTNPDRDFLWIAGLPVGDGPNMHNWLLNRVRYIVGESFPVNNQTVVAISRYQYPNTPLPDAYNVNSMAADVKTIMSNLGAGLYLNGKMGRQLLGLKFDNELVQIRSTRVGLLKVGEGLFHRNFLLNPNMIAPVNSISRLGTLFHEARHSDGNSRHTGFVHDVCPANHAYANYAACEISGNGSYSIGAFSIKHMMQNCTACSQQETNMLAVKVMDQYSRIVKPRSLQKNANEKSQIKSYNSVLKTYEALSEVASIEDKDKLEAEINRIRNLVSVLEGEIGTYSQNGSNPLPSKALLDPRPEGQWIPVSLRDSMRMMDRSLNGR